MSCTEFVASQRGRVVEEKEVSSAELRLTYSHLKKPALAIAPEEFGGSFVCPRLVRIKPSTDFRYEFPIPHAAQTIPGGNACEYHNHATNNLVCKVKTIF